MTLDEQSLSDPAAPDDWKQVATVLWRRLDVPGFEICHLRSDSRRIMLEGLVLNELAGVPRSVRYHVLCDRDWLTLAVAVSVRTGSDVSTRELRRAADGRWLVDGEPQPAVQGPLDVDLGFTPSTNTLPIRRLALDVGASAEVAAAWLRFPDLSLHVLPQRYTRRAARRYDYESDGGRFRAALEVDEHALVETYEGLFQRVARMP